LSAIAELTERNTQPLGDWEAEENGTDKKKGAIFVQAYKSRARDLDLEA